jgi:hypothetical protein
VDSFASASLAVSLLAIGIALVSLRLAFRADRRQTRTAEREERHEKREIRARPVVIPRGGEGGPTAQRVVHNYQVKNAGYATITSLWLWIEGGHEKMVSTTAGGSIVLAPNETAHMAVG